MMRQETELRQSLQQGTALVIQASDGTLSIPDFVEKYDNFYYYEALDGHEEDEAGRALLQKYSEVISAHEKAQTNVVDVTFLGPEEQRKQYLVAGRITADEAMTRLDEIVNDHHLRDHLATLSA